MTSAEIVSSDLLFPLAFERWIESRTIHKPGSIINAHYISDRTEWDYRQYARALNKMFSHLTLGEIHEGHLREYHRARACGDPPWSRPAGANRIRKEVGMLIAILTLAGCWNEKEMKNKFQKLQRHYPDIQRALEPDEQDHFLRTAASRERWALVFHYTVVALQTCASTNELRGLRLGDVTLNHGCVKIRNEVAKNKYRVRTIPLETSEVIWSFEWLIERCREQGGGSPHHYLFPFRDGNSEFDPSRPMSDSGLKKRWDEVRTEAGLKWLRPYDLRHSAITRMAEKGVPIAIIMAFAGHMSIRMQQHYTQVSMMAMRKAAGTTWMLPDPRKRPQSTWSPPSAGNQLDSRFPQEAKRMY